MSAMAQTSRSTSGKRRLENDLSKFPRKARKLEEPISDGQEQERTDKMDRPTNKHTKKERKQNRSTRIHSLRKLLSRDTLPSTIRQEKERELAALLHDQDQTKLKLQAKKTLGKYHYVRFVERQKAEKRLKQLRKQLEANNEDESIAAEIHEMEVNRNYAIYAPLNQKYISIFASRTDDLHSNDDGGQTSKPDMWHQIQAAMKQGQGALNALREGKVMASSSEDKDRIELEDDGRRRSQISGEKHVAKKEMEYSGRGQRSPTQTAVVADTSDKGPDDDTSDEDFFER